MWFTFENDFYSRTNKYVADASGNGRDGLRYGRPSSRTNYPTPVLSYDGSTAAEFHYYPNDLQDGQTQYFTGDYIAVTNLAGIRSLNTMTAAAWVKYYEGANNANGTIFSSGHNDLGNWRMGRDGDARTMFTLSPNGVALIPDYKFLAFPDAGITNQWHHYAVTWDGASHTAVAYFDGAPCATNSVDGSNVSALTFGPAAHDLPRLILRRLEVLLTIAASPFDHTGGCRTLGAPSRGSRRDREIRRPCRQTQAA